jgi:CBS domain-containing protein
MISSADALLREDIKGYVQKNVPTVRESATVDEALEIFKKNSARALYTVKDKGGALSGVITPCDLAKLNQAEKPKTALDLATTDKIIGVRPDAELWQLLKIMNGDNVIKKHFDQLPVLNEDNQPIGIVTKDALRDKLSAVQIPE